MGKESGGFKRKSKVMLYMLASLLLVAGGLVLAGRMLDVDADTAGIKGVLSPEIAQAPDPVKEPVADKPDKKAAAKDEDKKEEPVAEAPVAEAPVVEEAPAAEAPIPSSTAMTLSVPAMGLSGDPIYEGVDPGTLMNGAGHAPNTGYPWVPGSNTYVASHVLGYEGTGSYMHFANLPNVGYGDQIFITDANGTQYTYNVSEILQVGITELWVMDPTGKDQISLQTCINPPAYDVRLVVRGDLVDVQPA